MGQPPPSRSGPLAALVAAALLVLSCAAPGGKPAAASASAAPAAVLRVGTSGDYPPFSLATGDGRYRGLDVDLAERFAADAGLAIEWVPFHWPDLEARLAANDFDVALSGVTWRPWRAVVGYMTRAIATGGPCVVGAPGLLSGMQPRVGSRVAVNRGGVLERFARTRLAGAQILAIDRNLELATLLRSGAVDAVVTDSFELGPLGLGDAPRACEPPLDRKVAWVAPARADSLGPRLDEWLGVNEERIQVLRIRWLGDPAPRSELDHLLDLLARRLAEMPAIAAWKRARGLPIGDAAREEQVVEAARAEARAAGLAPEPVAALFRLQIGLGKLVQARAPAPADEPVPDLAEQVRPELVRLGARIVDAAARQAPLEAAALDAADWTALDVWLAPAEHAELRAALLALRPAD